MKMIRFFRFIALVIAIAIVGLVSCEKEHIGKKNRNIAGKTETGAAVIVMEPGMVSSKLEGIDENGTLTFNSLAAEDMPVKGDIICSAPSKAAPQGFLYKVKKVTAKGNETVIVTEEATLEEAVEAADVNEVLDISISEIEVAEGVEIEAEEDVEIEGLQKALGSQLQSKATLEVKIQKIKIDIPMDDHMHIKGSVDIGAKVNCEVKIEWFQMKRFLLTTQPYFKTKLEATVESKIEKEKKVNIATLKYAPVTVWVGPVPLVFTPKLSLDVILTITGEVTLQATLVDWDYSYLFGVRYQNGKLEAISENTSKPAKYLENVQFTMTGELKVQPVLNYRYDLYNTGTYVGMFGDFYAKLKAAADKTGSGLKLAFSCGLDFGADAQLKILGYKIGSLKRTFLSLEWPIWEKIWGIQQEIFDIIPNEILEEFRDLGIEIHGGYNPPNIEGTYLVTPCILLASNFNDSYYPGFQFADYQLTFSEQNDVKQTVVCDYINGTQIGSGLGSFISGDGDKFSVFTEVTGTSGDYNYPFKSVEVYSGEITPSGIKNFHCALIMTMESPVTIKNGQGRLIYDSDGFSERLSLVKTRVQNKKESSSATKVLLPSIHSK